MSTSLVTACVSFVIIFIAHMDYPTPGLVDVSKPLPLTHFILGVMVTGAKIANAVLSLCRCRPSHDRRWIYNIVHGKVIGYSVITLARKYMYFMYVSWDFEVKSFSWHCYCDIESITY